MAPARALGVRWPAPVHEARMKARGTLRKRISTSLALSGFTWEFQKQTSKEARNQVNPELGGAGAKSLGRGAVPATNAFHFLKNKEGSLRAHDVALLHQAWGPG